MRSFNFSQLQRYKIALLSVAIATLLTLFLSEFVAPANLALDLDYIQLVLFVVVALSISTVAVALRQERQNAAMIQPPQTIQDSSTQANQLAGNILESITDAFFALDQQWCFIYINRHSEDIFQRSRESLLGQSIWEAFPEIVGSVYDQQYRRAMQEQVAVNFESLAPDGTQRYFEIHAYPTPAGLAVYFREMTQRKQAEMALVASEFRLRRLVDSNIIGVIFWDESGQITDANDAFLKIVGYQRSDLVAGRLNRRNLTPEEQLASSEQLLNEMKASGTSSYCEKEYIRADGTRVPVLLGSVLLEASTTQGVSFVLDLTQLKQTEAALRESVSLYRTLTEVLKHHVWIARSDGFVEYVNKHWYDYSGATLDDFNQGNWSQLFHPEDVPRLQERWAKMLTTGETEGMEYRIRGADGQYRWFLGKVAPLKDARGKIIRWVGTNTDIDDRKRFIKELHRREQQFKTLAENAPDVIERIDRNYRHLYASPAIETVTGIAPEAFIGKTPEELGIPEELSRVWRSHVATVFATKQPTSYEFIYPTTKGDRYYQMRLVPEFAADGSVETVLTISRDLTELQRHQQALYESEQTLKIALETAQLGTWQLNLSTMTLTSSDLCKANFGLSPTAEFTYEKLFELIHPEDRDRVRTAIATAIQNHTDYDIKYRIIWADSSLHSIVARGRTLYAADGKPLRMVGVTLLITEPNRKQESVQMLVEASAIFNAEPNYQTALRKVADLVVPTLADYCFFDIVSADNTLERIAWQHAAIEKREHFQQIQRYVPPIDAQNNPVVKVLHTGQPQFTPQVTDEWLQATALNAEHLQFLREFQPSSTISVPLVARVIARDRRLGVLTFCREARSQRHYTHEDFNLAVYLAYRTALAIDNALQYQAAERKETRAAHLQVLNAALLEALTSTQVAELIVNQSMTLLGAANSAVSLLTDQKSHLKTIATIGYSPAALETWEYFPMSLPCLLTDSIRTKEPIFLKSFDAFATQYPHLVNNAAFIDKYAFAAIPLLAEGQSIGGIALNFDTPQAFSAQDCAFMLALGAQCSAALARTHLYEAQQHIT